MRRSGTGVEPTPRAQALWPVVQTALAQLEGALAPERFEPALADNSFVLAMADATAAALLPHMVRILAAEAPSVSVRVLPLATRDPRRLLDDEAADLAIGYPCGAGGFDRTQPDRRRGLLRAPAGVRRRIRLPDAQEPPPAAGPLTLDQYCAARHLLVSFSGRPYGFTDEALAALGRERRIVLTVNQFFTAGRVVANSDLLTVLPLHFFGVTGLEGTLVWRPLPLQLPTVHVDALCDVRRAGGAAQRWLRDVVARAAAAEHLPQQSPTAV